MRLPLMGVSHVGCEHAELADDMGAFAGRAGDLGVRAHEKLERSAARTAFILVDRHELLLPDGVSPPYHADPLVQPVSLADRLDVSITGQGCVNKPAFEGIQGLQEL
jgi:hypothetical protein